MIIISLSSNIAGPACAVATSIKNNLYLNKNYPTNFFDYLVVSLKSVNELLSIKESDIQYLDQNLNIYNNLSKSMTVEFNNFNKLISYHDLKKDYDNEDFINFIDKYKRRYFRLLNYIKNEKEIYFIRYGEENINEIKIFCNIIKNLNSNLFFRFVNVIYNENKIYVDIKVNNYLLINFNDINDKNIKYNEDLFYRTLQFNWLKIFEIININYKKMFENK